MNDPALQVRLAIQRGELARADLTARRLGGWLGKTTSVLYHHWGSLDGFLFAVAQSGFDDLGAQLIGDGAPEIEALAERYIDFALACPALYELMFHRAFDWPSLRTQGQTAGNTGLTMFRLLAEWLACSGSAHPVDDARTLFAGLHGLASLAITGRANIDDIQHSDRDVAVRTARHLCRALQENRS